MSRLADLVPRKFPKPVWTWTWLADPLPPHTRKDGYAHTQAEERNPLSGKRVRIILPPRPVAEVAIIGAPFNCDTELVWEIHPLSIQELTGSLPEFGRRLYLCEHQFKHD